MIYSLLTTIARSALLLFTLAYSTLALPGYTPQKMVQYIIVHGTAAADVDWYRRDGGFFKEVEKSAKLFEQPQNIKVKVLGYTWSGGLLPSAREEGARNLANLIENFDPETEIRIIAHSHGTNVAHRASQILAERNSAHRIAVLYGLGTPIDYDNYEPNMNIIGYIYNFFSYYDPAQTVWGSCDREYKEHERIVNIRTVVSKSHADHFDIHDPIVGRWLPTLHHFVYRPSKNNQPYPFNTPIVMYFDEGEHTPKYEIDYYRNAWRAMDQKFEQKYWRYYVRKAFSHAPKVITNPLQWTPKAVKDFVRYYYTQSTIWVQSKLYKKRLQVQERLEKINQKILQIITGEAIAGSA